MKASHSFFLGIAVGLLTVLIVDRARKSFREEDVEALKDRISDSLQNLESTVAGLAEGLTETFSEALD
ncbi:MAG TPA: hypothetical protein VHE55_14445 [Fimbriimonadaceae bacterium]|nr:hypothetical protein [Fimbriimonadaceae bacterium]